MAIERLSRAAAEAELLACALLVLGGLMLGGAAWLNDHPQHNPRAPLDLQDPVGWTTAAKLSALRGNPAPCQAVLERSGIAFQALEPAGEGACRRADRLILATAAIRPAGAPMTCSMAAGLVLWLQADLQPLAQATLGSRIAHIRHLGTYHCRRMQGAPDAPWSEHATGNAIDVAGFVLEDGRTIRVLGDWPGVSAPAHDRRKPLPASGNALRQPGAGAAGRFLRGAHAAACRHFGTVLSPDANAAHRDHLHLDHGRAPGASRCRAAARPSA